MDYQERKQALPYPLQDRLSGFERRNPYFLPTFGDYELSVCEQAEIIANSLKDPLRFPGWWELSWGYKHYYTPELDDTITLEALQEAVNLAYALLTNPNLVPQMHGALCGAVGCRAYGCFSQEEDAEEENDDYDRSYDGWNFYEDEE